MSRSNSTTITQHSIELGDIIKAVRNNTKPTSLSLWKINIVTSLSIPEEIAEQVDNVECWGYLSLDYELPGRLDIQYFTITYPFDILKRALDKYIPYYENKTADRLRVLLQKDMRLDWDDEEE